MPKQYNREELWKLYQKIPKELQEAIFAEETAEHIGTICERYDIQEEIISEIAKQIGNVLLGILPPEDFQETLEKEIKLKKDVAKKVSQEINRFIFSPVKDSLATLYKIGVPLPEKPAETPSLKEASLEEELKKKDIYREPIE